MLILNNGFQVFQRETLTKNEIQAHLAFNWKTDEIIFEIRSDARKGGGGGCW